MAVMAEVVDYVCHQATALAVPYICLCFKVWTQHLLCVRIVLIV